MSSLNTASHIGERQILPKQTNSTCIIFIPPFHHQQAQYIVDHCLSLCSHNDLLYRPLTLPFQSLLKTHMQHVDFGYTGDPIHLTDLLVNCSACGGEALPYSPYSLSITVSTYIRPTL